MNPRRLSHFALALLIAGVSLSSSARAQSPVLSGSAEVDVGLNKDPMHVSLLVQDISHILGIVGQSLRPDPKMQSRFNSDVVEFNALLSAQVPIAGAYAPCVSQYRAAWPHYWNAANMFVARASMYAINPELRSGGALQNAGDKCAARIDVNRYELAARQNGGSTGTNPQPNPAQAPWPAAPNYPAYPSGVANNRPIQGGITWDPCLPNGPGYDYCVNPTQPAFCHCNFRRVQPANQPPQPAPQPADPGLYFQGLVSGIGQCVQGVAGLAVNVLAAAWYYSQRDYVDLAKELGIDANHTLVGNAIQGISQELGTNRLGANAYEAGQIDARRLCMYGILPNVPKVAKAGVPARAATTAALTPEQTLWNSSNLVGKAISTQRGPLQIGNLIGEGKYGNVYDLPTMPGKVIKVSMNAVNNGALANTSASFPGQIAGANALKGANIATPAIYDISEINPPNQASFLVMDNISKWPGAQIVENLGNSSAAGNAIRDMFNTLGNQGLLGPDLHAGNTFVYRTPLGWKAGVLDSDMVFQAAQAAGNRGLTQVKVVLRAAIQQNPGTALANSFEQTLAQINAGNLNAQLIMNQLFRAIYPGFSL
jgi:hypothetical protein